MRKTALFLLLALPLPATAQGRGRPPAEDHLSVTSAFSGRSGFDSRAAGFKSSFALGRLGSYSFGGSADAAHLRTWAGNAFPAEQYDDHHGKTSVGAGPAAGLTLKKNF